MKNKGPPDDHLSPAWLAKVCNGIEWYRKVHTSFLLTPVNIILCISTQKIVKLQVPEI
jgi:hypothetical protein